MKPGIPPVTKTTKCCRVCRLPLRIGVNHTECRALRLAVKIGKVKVDRFGPRLRGNLCDAPDCGPHWANAETTLIPCDHRFCYESAKRYHVSASTIHEGSHRCPVCYRFISGLFG